jgi:hypothetical protein
MKRFDHVLLRLVLPRFVVALVPLRALPAHAQAISPARSTRGVEGLRIGLG